MLCIDYDIPCKSGYKVTVKPVDYLTDEIGSEEERNCGRFFWGLIPGISLRLLKETKKLEYALSGGNFETETCLSLGIMYVRWS